jgi:hypothetical protein
VPIEETKLIPPYSESSPMRPNLTRTQALFVLQPANDPYKGIHLVVSRARPNDLPPVFLYRAAVILGSLLLAVTIL